MKPEREGPGNVIYSTILQRFFKRMKWRDFQIDVLMWAVSCNGNVIEHYNLLPVRAIFIRATFSVIGKLSFAVLGRRFGNQF